MPDWTTSVPWAPHQKGLAEWAARRWRWDGEADWPSSLALLAAAHDEGHTGLDWNDAPALWARRFEELPFELPGPDAWPASLFEEGWLKRTGLLVQTSTHAALERRLFEALASRVERSDGGKGQDEAVARCRDRLLLLAGGPGTGKTTTLKRVVAARAEAQPGLRAVLAAPTGRAAARAQESFADAPVVPDCLTLHRLLGLRPGLGDPWHGPHRPLPFDLVIVDEASMLDLATAVALVDALLPEASLVLVGDPGQLPSVESGAVLADLLAHPRFAGAVVRLHQRFRLQAESRTLAALFDALQAEAAVEDFRTSGADFEWLALEGDPGPAALKAWGSPRGLSLADLGKRILLSPVHQGPGSVDALNALADRALGRAPGTVDDGLPWMIRKNLPHLKLNNGDRGLVVREGGRLWYVDDGHRLPFSLVAEDGQAAWAVTVHKSQGSEFDTVVLVLPPRPTPVLARELIYTGLTRAKRRAVLVGAETSLAWALSRRTVRTSGFSLLELE